MIGCDLNNMSSDTLNLLSNEEIIAINQDSLGKQGDRTNAVGDTEVWSGPLQNGDVAVVLFNKGTTSNDVVTDFSSLGITTSSVSIRDLLNK